MTPTEVATKLRERAAAHRAVSAEAERDANHAEALRNAGAADALDMLASEFAELSA